jgi:hypothetical protein
MGAMGERTRWVLKGKIRKGEWKTSEDEEVRMTYHIAYLSATIQNAKNKRKKMQ